MKELQATVDLDFIKEVMQKTHRRIDTHAFHTIIWGCIVFVWYPLGNYFVQAEMMTAYFALIPICLVLGGILSGVSEYRRAKTPLEGENTFISRQVVWIICGSCQVGVAHAVAKQTHVVVESSVERIVDD